MAKIRVLFLSAWYPNRNDAMEGLFVRKHAQAVSRYCDVKVLFVCADKNVSSFEIEDTVVGGVNEITVYYPVRPGHVPHKLRKSVGYLRAYVLAYRYLNSKKYHPELLHVNVLTRTGVMAYLYRLWKGTPYVVMEHWSRYLPQNFSYSGFVHKKVTELVVHKASAVMAVSELLRESMKSVRLENDDFEVVHNVVDDFFVRDRIADAAGPEKKILHVSCFDEPAKNVLGLLRAVKLLLERRTDFELVIAGDGKDFKSCVEYARLLGLPSDNLKFIGEVTPLEIAELFQQSAFFVLFSNYETASVVIAESLVSGVPVVSTPVGIVPELVDEQNGLVVEIGNEEMLCEKMDYMLDCYEKYDRSVIRGKAEACFSFDKVGGQLCSIYDKVLKKERNW